MTGFGRGASAVDGVEVVAEVYSVNRRNLEVNLNLPKEWSALERGLTELVRQAARRGRVQCTVTAAGPKGEAEGEDSNAAGALSWDEAAVERTLERLGEWAARRGYPFEPDARVLLDLACIHRSSPGLPGADAAQPAVEEALEAALAEFDRMRRREGEVLAADLGERLEQMRRWREEVGAAAGQVVGDYRQALLKRLAQAGLEIDLEDERVLREIALFADRCDIAEELTRIGSHLDQLADVLGGDGLAGRKIEFILQEINRECNTMAAKANSFGVSRRAVDFKNEIERIREQALNLE